MSEKGPDLLPHSSQTLCSREQGAQEAGQQLNIEHG
jgi:hypothetical protein